MRCLACNVELTDYEATRQNEEGRFIDLCNYCYNSVKDDVTVVNGYDTNIVQRDVIPDNYLFDE